MVELLCQSKTCFISYSLKLEKVDNGLNDGSWTLTSKQLVDEGVKFENHCWWTENHSMEKLISGFKVLF